MITDNTAEIGAGIHLYYTEPLIANSTFVNNIATSGGGAIDVYQATPNIINSIIWDNSPMQIDPGYLATINLVYSDIQGGWNGEGNIDVLPELNDDFSLSNTSPCIDAGTAYYEFEDELIFALSENDFNGSAPDMGAIESEQLILGDVNFDGIINVIDIVQIVGIILGNYIPSDDEYYVSDINQDSLVNVIDIVQIVDIILEN